MRLPRPAQPVRCVTCGLPIRLTPNGWAHEATLMEVLGRGLAIGAPARHNVMRHATPRNEEGKKQ